MFREGKGWRKRGKEALMGRPPLCPSLGPGT